MVNVREGLFVYIFNKVNIVDRDWKRQSDWKHLDSEQIINFIILVNRCKTGYYVYHVILSDFCDIHANM